MPVLSFSYVLKVRAVRDYALLQGPGGGALRRQLRLAADNGVGAGGERHDLAVVVLRDLGLDDSHPLAPLSDLRGRGERPRPARLEVVDLDLDRHRSLALFDYRPQSLGHRNVDQGIDDSPVD